MTDLIKFTCTGGPYGDATASYKVDFPKGWTFLDFVEYVTLTYSKEHREWGDITVGSVFSDKIVTYREGEAFYFGGENWHNDEEKQKCLEKSKILYKEYLNRKVASVSAHGGWSAMDYVITLEEVR